MTIKKRPADGIYFCQLSLEPSTTSSSTLVDAPLDTQFRLGLIGDAVKYIQQYVKIFSEDGRRPITIKHNLIHSSSQSQSQQQHLNTNNSNNGNIRYIQIFKNIFNFEIILK